MDKKKNLFFNGITYFLILVICLSMFTGTLKIKQTTQPLVRTEYMEILPQYETYIDDLFYEAEIWVSPDEEEVFFEGIADFSDVEQARFYCSFEEMGLAFNFTVEDSERTIIEEQYTQGFIDDYGSLDACITIDNREYYISDYKDIEVLGSLLLELEEATVDNVLFGWFSRKVAPVIILVYLVVAQTAEQIKAESNYQYNKSLERSGRGASGYITSQSASNAAEYRFGFTTFDNVGCEVAAVYNLRQARDGGEDLSETIYKFENWAIEFASGWGYLGSNPREIYRYLNREEIAYEKYTGFSAFEDAVETAEPGVHIIMSRWNSNLSGGLHTFYVYKEGYSTYCALNFNVEGVSYSDSIEEFNNGSGFIVGYLIYE